GERRKAETLFAAARPRARRCRSRQGASSSVAAARNRTPSRGRQADCRRARALWPLHQARRQFPLARARRRRADGRHQPRREPARRATPGARPRTARIAAQLRSCRRQDHTLQGPLWKLRQPRRRQRHPAPRRHARGTDRRAGRQSPCREGGKRRRQAARARHETRGSQSGRQAEGRAEENREEKSGGGVDFLATNDTSRTDRRSRRHSPAARPANQKNRTQPKPPRLGRLPTREEVLDYVASSPVPLARRDLARAFKVPPSQRVALKGLLRDIERSGSIERGPKRKLAAVATL